MRSGTATASAATSLVRPGQLNLMTAGHGIAHSEFSVGDEPLLHALQLWVALPADAGRRSSPRSSSTPTCPGSSAVACGRPCSSARWADAVSPATVHTPLVGADLELAAGAAATVPLRRDFEHALLVLEGEVEVAGTTVAAGPLLYLGTGRDALAVSAAAGARALLLGGEPFPDELVMWWNFVGRSHEEIAAARADWERGDDRFGQVAGHGDQRIPAPVLPGVHLRPRGRRPR